MTRLRRMFLPFAVVAGLFHSLVLGGCGGGGGSSSTGPSGGAQVRLKYSGRVPTRAVAPVAPRSPRSASGAGATVLVDGVVVGVTDASGEIVLQLAPGTHTVTVQSGGVTSAPFQVTVTEGETVTLDVEMGKDGTLVVEQDKDRDGDYDKDDADDDDEDEGDVDDSDDDDEDDDDEGDGGSHGNGTVTAG